MHRPVSSGSRRWVSPQGRYAAVRSFTVSQGVTEAARHPMPQETEEKYAIPIKTHPREYASPRRPQDSSFIVIDPEQDESDQFDVFVGLSPKLMISLPDFSAASKSLDVPMLNARQPPAIFSSTLRSTPYLDSQEGSFIGQSLEASYRI